MLNLIDISINMGISSLKRYKYRYLYPFRELIPILIDTSSKLSISKKLFGFTKYRISSTKFPRRLLLFESIFICHISNDFFFFIKVLPYICAQLCASQQNEYFYNQKNIQKYGFSLTLFFLFKDRIVDCVLKTENTGQRENQFLLIFFFENLLEQFLEILLQYLVGYSLHLMDT